MVDRSTTASLLASLRGLRIREYEDHLSYLDDEYPGSLLDTSTKDVKFNELYQQVYSGQTKRANSSRCGGQEAHLEGIKQVLYMTERNQDMVRDILLSIEPRHNEPTDQESKHPVHSSGDSSQSRSFATGTETQNTRKVYGQGWGCDVHDGVEQKDGAGRNIVTPENLISEKMEKQQLVVHQNLHEMSKNNKLLQEQFHEKKNSSAYQRMQTFRQRLPVWSLRDKITDVIGKNQVVVISGDTGCGKTTQVPQFLLDTALQSEEFNMNIICSQPRRIAAVSVAQRVAEERAEQLGSCVGYQIRLEAQMSSMTRLLYCTTGIILRRLEGDPDLTGVTHIIVDEVHERTAESDFLLMTLRLLLQKKPELRLVLMSATINAQLFSEFFGNCPVLEIPGRIFEVQQFFLEDVIEFTRYRLNRTSHKSSRGSRLADTDITDKTPDKDLGQGQLLTRYQGCSPSTIMTLSEMNTEDIDNFLIMKLLMWIVEGGHKFPVGGAVLVFLPGLAEIQALYDLLVSNPEFQRTGSYEIIPVHSSLTTEEQNAAFRTPEQGVIKIVIATNIAETSITIDDIVYVIDAGWMKEMRYDQKKHMESLDIVRVSKANAVQRKGRAGRVKAGVCFHMFTSHQYRFQLDDHPLPEIQRISLEQLVLRVKMLPTFRDTDIEVVLGKLLEPPSQEAISGAVKRLFDLGALDENENLTPLGYYVGSLPVDVRIGKLMLFGAIFRCLDPALTIAAMLSFKSPFMTPFDSKKKELAKTRKMQFATGNSDYLTMLKAYKEWTDAKGQGPHQARAFCKLNFLNERTLKMLAKYKQQFAELLSNIGFIQPGIKQRHLDNTAKRWTDGVADIAGANENSDNQELISAVLVAALYPNVSLVLSPGTVYPGMDIVQDFLVRRNFRQKRFVTKDGPVNIHPSSVIFKTQFSANSFIVYHEKVKTNQVYIRECSMVPAIALVLFSGGSTDVIDFSTVLSMDGGWIRFVTSSKKVAKLARALRLELNQLLAEKMLQPHVDLFMTTRGSQIINCIVKLISSQ